MLKRSSLAKKCCQEQINKSTKKKAAKYLLIAILILAVFLFVNQVQAQTLDVGLNYAAATGLPGTDIRIIISNIIRVFLGLLGIVALSLIIYGGYTWMTAAGNPEKVEKAKKILINASIGLVIILSAYAIVSFIISAIIGGQGGGGGGGQNQYGGGGGALGNGIIQSHYPGRNAVDIPRNTSIVITFKEPMDINTLTSDGNTRINSTYVWIYKSDDRTTGKATPSGKETQVINASANMTPDNKTVVFKPDQFLGSPDQNTKYIVELRGGIKKQNGQSAFGNLGGYIWEFEVSTIIDVTPPKIVSVIPIANATYPRNVVIQINFSEAINPLTIGGKVEVEPAGTTGPSLKSGTFNFINVNTNDDPQLFVAGEFYYSNQYRTTEFVTNDLCGKNSCGNNVYCLPGPKTLSVLAKAADISVVNPQAPNDPRWAILPYTGIVDMADNSLDGNGNNIAEGPVNPPYDLGAFEENNGDSAIWHFTTTGEIRLQPPQITAYFPNANDTGVNPLNSNPFTIDFDEIMMSSTLKPDSNYGDNQDYIGLIFPSADDLIKAGYPGGGWAYWLESKNLPEGDVEKTKTQAIIYHATLGENILINTKVGSGVKDIFQNCYMPCAGPSCTRQETNIPGQYTQGTPWTGTFPSCDLTQ